MKSSNLILSAVTALAAMLCAPSSASGQSILKTAGNFTLLGGTAVTSSGASGTIINGGNVGSATAVTGFNDHLNDGNTEAGASVGPGVIVSPYVINVNNGGTGTALTQLIAASGGLALVPITATKSGVDLGGTTLTPGVYFYAGAATLTGALTLDAQHKNNVFWIFQVGTTMTTALGSTVTVINPGSNGGSDDGIFWVAETGAINFGANNQVLGNYLALTSITYQINTTDTANPGFYGGSRALAQAGVTLIVNQLDPLGGPSGSDWTGGLKYAANGTTVVPSTILPLITVQPLTQTVNAGATVVLTVAASGFPATFTYAWQKGGVPLSNGGDVTGATTNTLTLTGVSAADAASYTVTVDNGTEVTNGIAVGAPATSNPAVLTVNSGSSLTPIPVVTNNPFSAAGTVGNAFSFAILATNSPTTYGATGIPTGLTINSANGIISGTPTLAGTFVTTLSATNAGGTGTLTLSIPIAGAPGAPVITSPATAPGTVGTPFVIYPITATGVPTSYTAVGLPPGLVVNPLTGAITGTPTAAGTYTVTITATNSLGTGTGTVTITVGSATVPPVITSPTSAPGTVGTPIVTYQIAATGLPTSYTATGLPPGLIINALTGAINGTPTASGTFVVTITATNSAGTSTSTLTITIAPGPSSRIVNFSARAMSGPGSQSLILGFVVSGNGKDLLVRGIGPTLASFGITGALGDPMLSLFGPGSSGLVATNVQWQTPSAGQASGVQIAAAATQVGAFALPNGSFDTSLLETLNSGVYTTLISSPNGTSGIALTELYDTDGSSNPSGAKLVNVSARMEVTTGQATLIAGFVIAGTVPKTVLIRGVGPTLSNFGVTGVLADPMITVFAGATQIASNANWGTGISTAAQINTADAQVGAFALPAGSKDAALLLTVQPGTYTVVVSSVSGVTGVALVEIYDVQ